MTQFSQTKSAWIQKSLPELTKLFPDITELGRKVCRNVLGGHAPVDEVFLFTVGFSCKAVSAANNERAQYASCIDSITGTTGITFDGALSYCINHTPKVAIFENVPAFMGCEPF